MKLFHFHNSTPGGVNTVINNLIYFQQDTTLDQKIIHTYNIDNINVDSPSHKSIAMHDHSFSYSSTWNFVTICKRLSKYITSESDILIAHDWLELGMISTLGLSNPVIFFLHGEYSYYYQLAELHSDNIDVFICVSESISKNLKILLPHRADDIYYRRFPVSIPTIKMDFTKKNKIIFIGRCEKSKGYFILHDIEKNLHKLNCNINWTIVGHGHEAEKELWPSNSTVEFINQLPNFELLKKLHDFDIIILPSSSEGMPISIIEGMKAGVIPLVNDIPGGVQELIQNAVTGYKIKNNNPEEYASHINMLLNDHEKMKYMRLNCIRYASTNFDPIVNTQEIEIIYRKAINQNRAKRKMWVYRSRLDQFFIPNFLVIGLRYFKNRISRIF